MEVRISSELLATILAEAARTPGREVCGLLLGTADRVSEARPAPNVAAVPEHAFEIDPATLFAAIRAERAGGPHILGHYHSHPNGLAEPSARDAAMADRPGRLWLIVAGGGAGTWREVPGGAMHAAFEPVRLVVESGCA